MKKGGVGGGNTVTGLKFEHRASVLLALGKIPGYEVRGNEVYYKGEILAYSYAQHGLYMDFFPKRGIDYKKTFSKRYLPDEALYVPSQETIYIIEMKYQGGGGSVDEKPQTGDFKKKLYQKIFTPMGIKVEFIFILSDFFNKYSYQDTYDYLKKAGCHYFFENLPLEILNFPEVTVKEPVDQKTLDLE